MQAGGASSGIRVPGERSGPGHHLLMTDAGLLAITACTLPAAAASLEILRVLGGDEDDLLLHRPNPQASRCTTAGSLYARLGSGPHAAARITPRGEIELPVGPECPTDDFFARYKLCGTVEILPHPEHLCTLINPFQAEVMTIAGDGSIAQTFKIPEGPGDLQTASTEGGMSMSLTMTFSISHIDSNGRYWKIPYTDDGLRSIVLLDADFRETGDTIVLPEEIESHRFVESPRGEILAIQEWSSRILICRRVE